MTLKPGTLIHVGGVPAYLAAESEIDTSEADNELLTKHAASPPFQEYPKRITTSDGVEVEVKSAEEEATWRNPPAPPVPKKADPLADVTIEADAPETRNHDLELAEQADVEAASEVKTDGAPKAKKKSAAKKK
jgi:hypothetical protein